MLCRLAKQCEFLLGCLALLTSVAWAQPQLSYQRVSYESTRSPACGYLGTEVRRSRPSSTVLSGWRWTARATSTSPIGTTAFARSIPPGRSPRLRERESRGWRGRRSSGSSPACFSHWRGSGRLRQPLHRRFRQRTHSQGRSHRDDHHGCRDGGARRRRRRRAGDPGSVRLSSRRGGGRLGQPLHRRSGHPPHSQGRSHREDHHDCGHGGVWRRWGRRAGSPGPARLSH